MNRVNNRIKNLFAVLSLVTILMLIFCVSGLAANDDLKYTIGVGETVALSGFDTIENCTYDERLVKISSNRATAIAAGNAKVTYLDINQKQHTVLLTIKKAPSSVKLNATNVTLGVGESFNFDASFNKNEACRTYKYSTNKPDILVYSKSGIFTAKKTGSATVSVTTYNGKKATCKVTVKKAPSSVKLNATNVTLGVGESFNFDASFNKNEACRTYKYSTNKPDILVYSKSGIFTAKKTGSATVSVTTYNGKKATCKVTVKKDPSSVKLNANNVTLGVGESFNFDASFNKNEACRTYKYSTNKPDILVYSKSGIFTAKKTGSATVSVTTYNGKKATCKVTVKKAPSSVKLNANNVTLGVGESFNFDASFNKNEACRTYKYSTNKPDILVYSKSGIFTAKKTGSATVSVTTYNGKRQPARLRFILFLKAFLLKNHRIQLL